MVITRTPYRISFFGGGTDYPAWFRRKGGAVVSVTINRHCFITCRTLPPFYGHRYRVVYSSVENAARISEIQHPAVRAALTAFGPRQGLEIHHDGEVPARSGLGSSSSFTVGLIQALHELQGEGLNPAELARFAIHLEQSVIGEPVGSQDQVAASFGGFNRIDFQPDGKFVVSPLVLSQDRLRELRESLLLFHTGTERPNFPVSQKKIAAIPRREQELSRIREMVDEGVSVLESEIHPVHALGPLLDEAWRLKKTLASEVSSPHIDEIYSAARKSGALGGKILGAGGGGFMLLMVPPERKGRVRSALRKLIEIDFEFELEGSRVVYSDEIGARHPRAVARASIDNNLTPSQRFSSISAETLR